MAAPPPPLVDDVTAEIFLLLPPDEPEHLFRAALVCRSWLGIIRDPVFRRRYREFHGASPLLGLLHGLMVSQEHPPARFASTTLLPEFPYPGSDGRRMLPLDCRHGRVLTHKLHDGGGYLVWDPVTGDRHHVPREPEEIEWVLYCGAVLCATDGCDHLDCHGGPFRVVFVARVTRDGKSVLLGSVYSSETGAWSVPVCVVDFTCASDAQRLLRVKRTRLYYSLYLEPRRGTHVGDAVYFTLREENAIVKYDFVKDHLSIIDPSPSHVRYIALMPMESDNDTSLGFACIQGSSLYTWSRKVDTEEAAEWVQNGVIELKKKIPVTSPNDKRLVVGSAEGVGVVFISSGVGLFTVKLKSGQVKKVDGPGVYFSVLPYMSFYLPEIDNGGEHGAIVP